MSASIKHQFLAESAKGTYYTRNKLAIRNIDPSFIEPLIRSGAVSVGRKIPDAIWKQITRHHLLDVRTPFAMGTGVATFSTPELRMRYLRLILDVENDRGSQLYVSLPPADDPIAADRADSARLIVENTRIPLGKLRMRYWCAVAASERPYTVGFEGAWPANIDRSIWSNGTVGLEPRGTIFALRQSEWRRQLPGATLSWGETVHLLYSPSAGAVDLPDMKRIEMIDSWQLARYSLPTLPVQHTQRWFAARGFAIEHQPPRLTMLSQAKAYDRTGKPIFDPEENILFEIVSQPGATPPMVFTTSADRRIPVGHTVRPSDRYMSVNGPSRGSVEISAGNTALSDLILQVDHATLPDPPSLSVTIRSSTYTPFETENHILLSQDRTRNHIAAACPIAVRWSWKLNDESRIRHAPVSDMAVVSAALTEELMTWSDRARLPARLEIQGGPFGIVRLIFEPPRERHPNPSADVLPAEITSPSPEMTSTRTQDTFDVRQRYGNDIRQRNQRTKHRGTPRRSGRFR